MRGGIYFSDVLSVLGLGVNVCMCDCLSIELMGGWCCFYLYSILGLPCGLHKPITYYRGSKLGESVFLELRYERLVFDLISSLTILELLIVL